ncbi:hypothetical protein [[Clostridium] hylemonae]|uniref:hypothetical protein n=1 Tax=[Clostridium] hylemonae TaxID=89153 RepID=UPI001FAA53EE|nr:hypothetical protein [[Clostridium] hylemonae]
MLAAIESIDENEYDLKEWQETVGYIIGNNTIQINDCKDAKEYLIHKLWKGVIEWVGDGGFKNLRPQPAFTLSLLRSYSEAHVRSNKHVYKISEKYSK